jgi:hypothetical protein
MSYIIIKGRIKKTEVNREHHGTVPKKKLSTVAFQISTTLAQQKKNNNKSNTLKNIGLS